MNNYIIWDNNNWSATTTSRIWRSIENTDKPIDIEGLSQILQYNSVMNLNCESIWESHDGRRRYIKDMDTNHITNCINSINRGMNVSGVPCSEYQKSCLPALQKELLEREEKEGWDK